jgi:hypothetical protein
MAFKDTINGFLNYISTDTEGNINIYYNNYTNTIDGLINNGSLEIEQYNNYINNSHRKFPNIQELNKITDHCKKEHSENFHSNFCSHIWLHVHH